MRFPFRPWQVASFLVLTCALAIGLVEWSRQRRDRSEQALLLRLPDQDEGVHLYLNVKGLRASGLLELIAGSRAAEETEYKRFVEETAFDYREDLDAILASFRDERSSFLLRGRFRWEQIRSYAAANDATCVNGFCRLETSRPGRWVSLYMVFPDVMSIAFSNSGWAATATMQQRQEPPDYFIPPQPFWIRLPSRVLSSEVSLPAGARIFGSTLKAARRVTFGVGASDGRFQIEMTAIFPAKSDAAQARQHLEQMTGYLKKMIAQERAQPSVRDLSGVLIRGKFEQQDRRVVGQWPVERDFLNALAEGNL